MSRTHQFVPKFMSTSYMDFERHTTHKPECSEGKVHNIGPGGINCPCCVKIHPSKLKIISRRYIRRKTKQELSYEQQHQIPI